MPPGNYMEKQTAPIDEHTLLAYLNGELDAATAASFERRLEDDPFLKDAAEGLQPHADPAALKAIVAQLNHQLDHQLKAKKSRRLKQILNFPWAYLAILLVLILGVLGFVVIRFFLMKR